MGEDSMKTREKNRAYMSCWKCKYNWRVFLPVTCCCRSSQFQTEEDSGFLEVASISWGTGIFIKGFKKTLTAADLGDLSRTLTAKVSKDKATKVYVEESAKHHRDDVSLTRVFWKIVRTKLLFSLVCLLLYVLVDFSQAAFIVKSLLSYIEESQGSAWDGLKLVLLLCLFGLLRSLLITAVYNLQLRSGIAARAAALGFIYHKLSRLKSVGSKSVGELVNLCANDAQRIFECCQFCTFLFGAPFLAILMSVYMHMMFGPSSLIGIAIMIAFLPIQVFVGRMIGRLRARVIGFTDKRVKMLNEIITCIKLIKMYGWEKSFAKVVRDIRTKEKGILVKLLFLQANNLSTSLLLPSIAPVATFAAHIAMGKNLTVSDAFTIMVMFNIFPPNMALLTIAVRCVSEARSAMKRIKSLLQLEDFAPYNEEPFDPSMSLVMTNCNFSWMESTDEMRPKVQKQHFKEENNNGMDSSKELHIEFKKTNSQAAGVTMKNRVSSVENQLIPTLFDLNLSVRKGSLVGVCGSVGSGKSSLIQAILAQMHIIDGRVQVVQHIAYVPQQAWIINDTVRNNITFGKSYDDALFKECCRACALDRDIKRFESGDLTEIGERGINLSGGQKQRVSLARALYADAEFYLLDDPLSAVDAHVGKYIFTNYIKERLRGKTCIFVTHQLQYLKDCDEVILMSDGRIEEKGAYLELINDQKEFYALINEFTLRGEENEQKEEVSTDLDNVEINLPDKSKQENRKFVRKARRKSSNASSISSEVNSAYNSDEYPDAIDDETERIRKGQMIAKEESSVGSVSWKVYCAFMKAGGGYIISTFAVIMQMSVLGIVFFTEWWLSTWLDRASTPVSYQNKTRILKLSEHPDSSFFMTIYGSVGGSMLIAQMIASMIFTFLFINASTNLHNNVLDSILKCPMKFYDTTPTGRIINRFSRDVDEIDGRLSWTVEALIRNGTRIFTALAFLAVIFPWLLIGFVPLSAIFVALFMLFRRTSRELKRIDNVTRSPIFSHVTATVQGLPVLRAFNKTDHFRYMFEDYVDKNSLPMYLFFLSGHWFSLRLDFVCITLSVATALLAVLMRGSIAPAFAGLAIMHSLRVTSLFQFTCRLAAETEARFTSVERMSHYSSELEHEGPFETDRKLPPWPSSGKIDFVNVNLRYRPNLPLTLKDVSFTINAKEKIGIAGRTGAGKSSLAVALFRLAEVEDGQILIDDEDTSNIGLKKLRSRLSAIPQDPVLFIGTIRYNLDPFDQHTDEQLWLALEKAYMKDAIASLPLKLETLVVENGENFSVGERQLICMARALLQESKILLLDEATAAIDSATDSKIQTLIRDSFKDCTVLTIAHRLNTIMDCDRVLVMEDGKIVEFDAPSSLLSNEDSLFAKMARTSKAST